MQVLEENTTQGLAVEEALENLGHDQALYAELLELFLETLDVSVRNLVHSATERQTEGSEHAHKLLGACLNVGAFELSKSCRSLEQAFEECRWVAADDFVARIKEEHVLVRTSAHKFLKSFAQGNHA